MGFGMGFCCPHCGHKFSIGLGVGFFFDKEFQKTNEAAKNGDYGEEWQQLMNSEELVVTDSESYFYKCERCCYWEVDKDLSLYVAIDPEKMWNRQYGTKTAREWGKIPYAYVRTEKEDWRLLKKRSHVCPDCEHEMKCYTNTDAEAFRELRCPACDKVFETREPSVFFWD